MPAYLPMVVEGRDIARFGREDRSTSYIRLRQARGSRVLKGGGGKKGGVYERYTMEMLYIIYVWLVVEADFVCFLFFLLQTENRWPEECQRCKSLPPLGSLIKGSNLASLIVTRGGSVRM